MGLSVKLYILDESGDKYMGAGVLWLLEGIEKTGSLLAASKEMGLSYSKARGMIEHIEAALGRPLIDRKKGGAEHRGAELTPFARDYILLYRRFQKEAKTAVEDHYREFESAVDRLLKEEGDE